MSKKELLEQNGLSAEEPVLMEADGEGAVGVSEDATGMDLNDLLCEMDGNGASGGSATDPPDGGGAAEGLLPAPEGAAETDSPEDAPTGGEQGGLPAESSQTEDDDAAAQGGDGEEPPAPEKPKRASRKKKAAEPEPEPTPTAVSGEEPTTETTLLLEETMDEAAGSDGAPDTLPDTPVLLGEASGGAEDGETEGDSDNTGAPAESHAGGTPAAAAPAPAARTRRVVKAPVDSSVLTIEARADVETPEDQEEIVWHEIRNAYRTRRMLTGVLGGIEQTEAHKTIAIVDYKGFRVVIPIKEMMIILGRAPTGQEYTDLMLRQTKILGSMLGAEVDFIVKGIETKSRSVVASRKDAMMKKRQLFYLAPDDAGMYRVHEGRVVQARVIAVAEKVIRVEAFGVECSIRATDLAWDWIGDAHDRYSVGDQILVRVRKVQRDSLEDISIEADVRSVAGGSSADNLKKVRVQSKYAGRVTDVHRGVVFIRLSNGVNAIAHSCYDRRMPGKKDDVSFAVTHLDEDRGVAMGIITRIIKQNL